MVPRLAQPVEWTGSPKWPVSVIQESASNDQLKLVGAPIPLRLAN